MKRSNSIMRRLPVALPQLALLALCVSCGGPAARPAAEAEEHTHRLTIPIPPAVMDEREKFAYVVEHYWDSFDATDTTWIADTAALEQAFADWTYLLGALPEAQAAQYPGALIRRAEGSPSVQLRLAEVAEHYLSDPNSPYRNEELFIPVLEAVLAAPGIDTLYKLRPQSLLVSAQKNRPGMQAADLVYTKGSGQRGRLSGIRAEYTLLMFYNPGCHDCARVEEHIASTPLFQTLLDARRLAVVALYPDEDLAAWREHLPQMPEGWIVGHCRIDGSDDAPYSLPAIPNLYLLDRQKRILLKDAPVEKIEAWLSQHAISNEN